MSGLHLRVHLHSARRPRGVPRPRSVPACRWVRDGDGERRHRGAMHRGPHRVSRLPFRVHLHFVAIIVVFGAPVPFRPAGGRATATANAGIEARCTEGRIA